MKSNVMAIEGTIDATVRVGGTPDYLIRYFPADEIEPIHVPLTDVGDGISSPAYHKSVVVPLRHTITAFEATVNSPAVLSGLTALYVYVTAISCSAHFPSS
jgi:hypothetical protein